MSTCNCVDVAYIATYFYETFHILVHNYINKQVYIFKILWILLIENKYQHCPQSWKLYKIYKEFSALVLHIVKKIKDEKPHTSSHPLA